MPDKRAKVKWKCLSRGVWQSTCGRWEALHYDKFDNQGGEWCLYDLSIDNDGEPVAREWTFREIKEWIEIYGQRNQKQEQ